MNKNIRRFLDKVRVTDQGCWDFTGSTDGDGYGQFWFQGRTIGAHRFSAEHLAGLTIHGLCVCHRCDRPICVNPQHLYAGTNSVNTQDRESKQRGAKGSKVGTSKLSEQQVKEIRDCYQQSQGHKGILTALAKQYCVSVTAIWIIVHNKGWRHC